MIKVAPSFKVNPVFLATTGGVLSTGVIVMEKTTPVRVFVPSEIEKVILSVIATVPVSVPDATYCTHCAAQVATLDILF